MGRERCKEKYLHNRNRKEKEREGERLMKKETLTYIIEIVKRKKDRYRKDIFTS